MSEEEVRKTIVLDASPSVVFKALTDEKELVHWMPDKAKFDPRVGGEYEFKYHWADRNVDGTVRGKILELTPNRKLSYTWDSQRSDFAGPRTEAVVTWELEELPDGKTRLTLIHSGIGKQFQQDTERGWSHYLGQLAAHVK
jgi:uncharacterized protein YndB with AHSA1/START domain